MIIRNLTPHPVVLAGCVIAPSGRIARVSTTSTVVGEVHFVGDDGMEHSVPLRRDAFGAVVDLPAPEDGVLLLVSAMVAQAAGRVDVMSPGDLVRDSTGRVVGANALQAAKEEES